MKDYKQKYEQALEIAKRCYKDLSNLDGVVATMSKDFFEKVFPELKEDGDERIRKALLEYFGEQCDMSNWNGIYGYEVYDWLKKQGEHKSTWSEKDENGLNDALWAIKQAGTIAKDENDTGNLWYAENWLKSLKNRVQLQPKQEWSEEDEDKIREIRSALYDYYAEGNADELFYWLKSLKERMKGETTRKGGGE